MELLNEFLKRESLSLAYILRIEVKTRKEFYEEAKTHTQNEFLNLSTIVI